MGLFGRSKAQKRPANPPSNARASAAPAGSPSNPSQAMIDRYAARLAAIAFEHRVLVADVHRSRVRTWDGHAYLPCGSTGSEPGDSTFYLDLDDGRVYRAVREGRKLTQTEPATHRTAHGLRPLLVSAGIPVPDPPAEWSDHRWPKVRGR
jgi:hypothetical protein